jgi:hypothetical protein
MVFEKKYLNSEQNQQNALGLAIFSNLFHLMLY